MKVHTSLLSLLIIACLVLAALPAMAQDLYDNGPVNGNIDAWNISFGYAVSNSFYCAYSACNVTGLSFWAWLIPGQPTGEVIASITSQPLGGGNTYLNELVTLTASNCFSNDYGYNVCQESGSFQPGAGVPAGVSWLTLSGGQGSDSWEVYWDENSGVDCGGTNDHGANCPSQAQQTETGTIPSEAFTIEGSSSAGTTGTTPEPSSIALFGSGMVGLAGVLRRKLFSNRAVGR